MLNIGPRTPLTLSGIIKRARRQDSKIAGMEAYFSGTYIKGVGFHRQLLLETSAIV
jgi:hypothetical protein